MQLLPVEPDHKPCAGDALFEVMAEDEGRDMWAVHLSRRDWKSALRAARSQSQRNAINAAAAEAAMAAGDARRAAELWGKVRMREPGNGWPWLAKITQPATQCEQASR
jgi:hypothetical protein